MATRSRTTFQKRQKELARIEKQRDKAARRMQRKLAGPEVEPSEDMPLGEGIDPLDPNDPTVQSDPALQADAAHPADHAAQPEPADQTAVRPAVVE